MAGRTLVFSWNKTRGVGLVKVQGENKISRTALRILLWDHLRSDFLRLV